MDVITSYNGANVAAVQNRPVRSAENGTSAVERQAPRGQAAERLGAVQAQPNAVRPYETNAAYLASLREENVTEAMLERAFEDANRALAGGSFSLSYSIHEGSNRIHVTVRDAQSQEVLREIPAESRLDIYARITEFVGLLFDQGN